MAAYLPGDRATGVQLPPQSTQGSGTSGGGGFMDILNLLMPVAAGVAASYGPGPARGATLALSGFRDFQRMKSNRKLGEAAAGMIDDMADEEHRIATETWKASAPTRASTKVHSPGDEKAVTDPTAFPRPFGPPGTAEPGQVKRVLKSEEVHKDSLRGFAENNPAPLRPKIYETYGAILRENPQVGLPLLLDRQGVIDGMNVKLSELRQNQAADSLEQVRASILRDEENEFRLKELDLQHEDARELTGMREGGANDRAAAANAITSARLAIEKIQAESAAAFRSQQIGQVDREYDLQRANNIRQQFTAYHKARGELLDSLGGVPPAPNTPGYNEYAQLTGSMQRAAEEINKLNGTEMETSSYTPETIAEIEKQRQAQLLAGADQSEGMAGLGWFRKAIEDQLLSVLDPSWIPPEGAGEMEIQRALAAAEADDVLRGRLSDVLPALRAVISGERAIPTKKTQY